MTVFNLPINIIEIETPLFFPIIFSLKDRLGRGVTETEFNNGYIV